MPFWSNVSCPDGHCAGSACRTAAEVLPRYIDFVIPGARRTLGEIEGQGVTNTQRVHRLHRRREAAASLSCYASGIQVQTERNVLGCAGGLQRVGWNRDIADGAAGVDNAVLHRPALHELTRGSDQIAIGVELEISGSRIQGVAGRVLYDEESVTVDGGVEVPSGGLNGSLSKNPLGLRRRYAAADLRGATCH